MSARRAVRGVVITIAALVAGTTTILIWVTAAAAADEGGLAAIASSIASGLTAVCYVVVGTLIEIRRPGHRVGRLLIAAGPLYGLLVLTWVGSAQFFALLDPWAVAVASWASIAASWAGMALIAGWIPLLFPTGSLPGPRWRLPAVVVGGLGTAGVLAGMVRPGPLIEGEPHQNPFGIAWWPPVLDLLVGAVPLLMAALVVLAFAGLAARFRSGHPVERVQVRWLLAGMAVVAAGFAGTVVEGMVRVDDGYFVTAVVFTFGILLIPVTIGVAILRYRLYDIDRVVSRTIAYGLVTATLVATFALVVLVLGTALSGVAEGETLAVAASTLVAFALFQPLRRRVQDAVDRRFDRARYDGERLFAAYTAALRGQIDLTQLRAAIIATTDRAVRPSSVAVWLRTDERTR